MSASAGRARGLHPPGEAGGSARGALHVVHHHLTSTTSGARRPTKSQTAPFVVLVHGSLDRGSSFARVVRRLGDLEVVTYDRRGYDRSRRQQAASSRVDRSPSGSSVFELHVTDLLEVIGGRRAVVVGHSFGGDVALGAAVRDPSVVRAVGAYEPPMPWVEWWPRRPERDLAGGDPGLRAEAFFRRVVGDAAWERLPERARDERRADGPALVAELRSLRTSGAPFDLTRLVQPVVLARGGLSVAHHRRAVDELQVTIPDAVVFEIPDASHGAHRSHPDSFAAFVRCVLERAGKPSAGAEDP